MHEEFDELIGLDSPTQLMKTMSSISLQMHHLTQVLQSMTDVTTSTPVNNSTDKNDKNGQKSFEESSDDSKDLSL